MIRKKSIFVVALLSLLIVLPIVSAQGFIPDMRVQFESVIRAFLDFAAPLFEQIIGKSSSNEFFFAKVLLLILLFVIINNIVGRIDAFGNTKGVSVIIALVISILGVRYISDEGLISGILLPYGALGVAITILLPFIIFFYFIHDTKMTGFGRRASWFAFLGIFLALWSSKYSNMGDVANSIYRWSLIGVVLVIILDKSIHRYFGFKDVRNLERGIENRRRARAQRDIEEYGGSDTKEAREIVANARRILRHNPH